MGNTVTISISINRKLLYMLDNRLEESTFNSRSELIQYLIRKWLNGDFF